MTWSSSRPTWTRDRFTDQIKHLVTHSAHVGSQPAKGKRQDEQPIRSIPSDCRKYMAARASCRGLRSADGVQSSSERMDERAARKSPDRLLTKWRSRGGGQREGVGWGGLLSWRVVCASPIHPEGRAHDSSFWRLSGEGANSSIWPYGFRSGPRCRPTWASRSARGRGC